MQSGDAELIDHELTGPTPIGAPTLRQSGRVLVFSAGYAAAFVGLFVTTLRVTATSPSPFAIVVAVGSGIGAAAIVAIYVHLLRRDGLRLAALGFTRPTWRLVHLLWQIPLIMTAAATVTMIVLGVLLQQEPNGGGDTIDGIAASAAWPTLIALLLVTAVLTPLWEEVLWRGLLFSALTRGLPTIAAAVISSAVFAAVHVLPVVMPYLFLLGLGACWLYVRHRTLWAPIALHAANNGLLATVAALS